MCKVDRRAFVGTCLHLCVPTHVEARVRVHISVLAEVHLTFSILMLEHIKCKSGCIRAFTFGWVRICIPTSDAATLL